MEHRQSRYLNNRAENPINPPIARAADASVHITRAPAPLSVAYDPIAQHFRPRRHRLSAPEYRQEMRKRCQERDEIRGSRAGCASATSADKSLISSIVVSLDNINP
jgi:putative transposase